MVIFGASSGHLCSHLFNTPGYILNHRFLLHVQALYSGAQSTRSQLAPELIDYSTFPLLKNPCLKKLALEIGQIHVVRLRNAPL